MLIRDRRFVFYFEGVEESGLFVFGLQNQGLDIILLALIKAPI